MALAPDIPPVDDLIAAARNPWTPTDVLDHLAFRPETPVLLALARNVHAPARTLALLESTGGVEVAEAVSARFSAPADAKPMTRGDIVRLLDDTKLYGDDDGSKRIAALSRLLGLARDCRTSPDILGLLAACDLPDVRKATLGNLRRLKDAWAEALSLIDSLETGEATAKQHRRLEAIAADSQAFPEILRAIAALDDEAILTAIAGNRRAPFDVLLALESNARPRVAETAHRLHLEMDPILAEEERIASLEVELPTEID